MMNKIVSAVVKDDFSLEVEFMGGDVKKYNMDYMLDVFPQFQVLKDNPKLFGAVRVDVGGYGVSWNDDLDIDAQTLWEEGVLVEMPNKEEPDVNRLLAYHLSAAREVTGMTQKELAEKTGIYQADISRIERGLANPSVSTLRRLAEGMNMNLVIAFESKNNVLV